MAGAPAGRVPRFVYFLAPAPEDAAGLRVGWRLVAANNRPLGRATHTEASLEGSRSSARLVRDHASRATPSATFDAPHGRWTWSVALDGAPVAVCVHPYLRRAECLRAMRQFLVAVEQSDPDAGVVRQFGPRSVREFNPTPAASGVAR